MRTVTITFNVYTKAEIAKMGKREAQKVWTQHRNAADRVVDLSDLQMLYLEDRIEDLNDAKSR